MVLSLLMEGLGKHVGAKLQYIIKILVNTEECPTSTIHSHCLGKHRLTRSKQDVLEMGSRAMLEASEAEHLYMTTGILLHTLWIKEHVTHGIQ